MKIDLIFERGKPLTTFIAEVADIKLVTFDKNGEISDSTCDPSMAPLVVLTLRLEEHTIYCTTDGGDLKLRYACMIKRRDTPQSYCKVTGLGVPEDTRQFINNAIYEAIGFKK